MRHRMGATLLVAFSSLSIMIPAVAAPSDEAAFVNLMNASRAASGLSVLATYNDLVDDARRHTDEMCAEKRIFHSTEAELTSVTTGWAAIGENVGMGPNPEILHQAFMASPSHKANILGNYDRVGVGVDRTDDGTMFVTVLFMKDAAAPVTTTTAPPPPPTTTTTSPPTPTTTTIPATPVPAVAPPPGPQPPSVIDVVAPPESTPVPQEPAAPTTEGSGISDVSWIEDLVLGRAFCVSVSPIGSVCAE